VREGFLPDDTHHNDRWDWNDDPVVLGAAEGGTNCA
jgi:hypothetical protein